MLGCVLGVAKAIVVRGAFKVTQRVVSGIARSECSFGLGKPTEIRIGRYVRCIWDYCDAWLCVCTSVYMSASG